MENKEVLMMVIFLNNIPKKYWYLSLRKMEVLVNYLQAI